MKKIVCGMLLTLAMGAQGALAAEVSLERGKELFESATLGTTGKSCASCHPGGRKLEWAGTSYDEEKLTAIVNRCIENALKGKPLDLGSGDMKSLVTYIRTFSGPGR